MRVGALATFSSCASASPAAEEPASRSVAGGGGGCGVDDRGGARQDAAVAAERLDHEPAPGLPAQHDRAREGARVRARDRLAVELQAHGADRGALDLVLRAQRVRRLRHRDDAGLRGLVERVFRRAHGGLHGRQRLDRARAAGLRCSQRVLEQQRAQHHRGQPRVGGRHQGRHAGHVRRRHRRARAGLVAAVAGGRDDPFAGRRDRHRERAVIGELRQRQPFGGCCRPDADQVRCRDRDREQRPLVDVGAGVAGRADDQHARGLRELDRDPHAPVVGRRLEAEVDDPRAVGGRVADALRHRLRGTDPAPVEDLDHHQLRPVGDADHATAVRGGGDRARHVGPVARVVAQVGAVAAV